MKRTVSTISDATIKDQRTITVDGWTGRLIAVTPCNGRFKLRIALDGGADLTTGWLDADEEVEIEGATK